jgi:hypothetical protein
VKISVFDESLTPGDAAGQQEKPHGLERLLQSERDHLEDLPRLAIDADEDTA